MSPPAVYRPERDDVPPTYAPSSTSAPVVAPASPQPPWPQRAVRGASRMAASPAAFLTTLALLGGWAVAGIPLRGNANWLIGLANASSVQVFVWDIFRAYSLRHEHAALKAMLGTWVGTQQGRLHRLASGAPSPDEEELALQGQGGMTMPAEPPPPRLSSDIRVDIAGDTHRNSRVVPTGCVPRAEQTYERVAAAAARFLGSPWAQAGFDASVVAWLCLGPKTGWSDRWQLWANAILAAQQTLCSTLLHHVSHHDARRLQRSAAAAARVAEAVAENIRTGQWCENGGGPAPARLGNLAATAITPQSSPVSSASSSASGMLGEAEGRWHRLRRCMQRRVWQPVRAGARAIERACVPAVDLGVHCAGSAGFVGLNAVLTGAWVGLGAVMGYNNPNWWLIIGTYTGMVSYVLEYMLRHRQYRDSTTVLALIDEARRLQGEVLAHFGKAAPELADTLPADIFHRTNRLIARAAATGVSVVGAVSLVGALVATATAMGWNLTAQLLCNTPTMVLDSEAFLILLAGNADAVPQVRARIAAYRAGEEALMQALADPSAPEEDAMRR